MVHVPADRQRLLQPRDERDRLPGGDPAAAVLRSRRPTTRSTTAAIGAVIGHEIGHGFDDQGSKYDGRGRAARTGGRRRTGPRSSVLTGELIDQYAVLEPAQHARPPRQRRADRRGEHRRPRRVWRSPSRPGGSRCGGAEPPVIDGLTGAQRFFRSWATVWQAKMRDAEQIRLLAIDPHSPGGVPLQPGGPQHRRVPRGVRTSAGGRAVARPGGPGADLVGRPPAGGLASSARLASRQLGAGARCRWASAGGAATVPGRLPRLLHTAVGVGDRPGASGRCSGPPAWPGTAPGRRGRARRPAPSGCCCPRPPQRRC